MTPDPDPLADPQTKAYYDSLTDKLAREYFYKFSAIRAQAHDLIDHYDGNQTLQGTIIVEYAPLANHYYNKLQDRLEELEDDL